ncbi:MAG: VCBS repeat-containing protein, partial [Chthoniobacterales bacterium]|nr:VCBS repeat-containing protein [Chthoniobacterales bacterium]
MGAPADPKFRAQTIDDKIEIGYGVATGDVDGDGKPDILLADKRQFVWYRNPTWEKFVLAENLTPRDNVCIAAQDIDGDGKSEVAVGGDWDPSDRESSGAVFYLIAQAERTQKWEAVKLHAEPTVHRMRWMKLAEGGWGLIVAPLHGRGDNAGSRVLLYHVPADRRNPWKTEVLNESMHATHNFAVVRSALVLGGREGLVSIWNDGTRWISQTLFAPDGGIGEVRDGFTKEYGFYATIEPMHGNRLVAYLYRPDRVAAGADPVQLLLSDKLVEGHALACAQLVPGGSDEIVVGWRGEGGGVRLFTAVDETLLKWRETVVADKGIACEDLCLADLNDDGKLDIVASGRATKNIV